LAKPRVDHAAHTIFQCEAYVLTKEEGGPAHAVSSPITARSFIFPHDPM